MALAPRPRRGGPTCGALTLASAVLNGSGRQMSFFSA